MSAILSSPPLTILTDLLVAALAVSFSGWLALTGASSLCAGISPVKAMV